MYDYPNHIGPLCSSEIAHLSYHSESWGPCILQCSHYSGWKGSDFFGDSPSVATLHSPFFLKVLKLPFLKKTSENIVENYGTHSSFGKKKRLCSWIHGILSHFNYLIFQAPSHPEGKLDRPSALHLSLGDANHSLGFESQLYASFQMCTSSSNYSPNSWRIDSPNLTSSISN